MTVGVAIFMIFVFLVGAGLIAAGIGLCNTNNFFFKVVGPFFFLGGIALAWSAISSGFERL
jgi:hypothetical protein